MIKKLNNVNNYTDNYTNNCTDNYTDNYTDTDLSSKCKMKEKNPNSRSLCLIC